MLHLRPVRTFAVAFCLIVSAIAAGEDRVSSPWSYEKREGRLLVSLDGDRMGEYVWQDERIPRPYFANLRAPGGKAVTRPSPPVVGEDPVDHAEMHPGIWLSFGDLNGVDFWRNKGRTEHAGFEGEVKAAGDELSFSVKNRYLSGERGVATETCRHTFRRSDDGYLLLWDSTLSSPEGLVLGDQEEMGFGVRVASPLRTAGGGVMQDDQSRIGERQIWGKSAQWCDSRTAINGKTVGIAIFSHPDNFRPSWMHVRDYGLMVANPFGRKALTGGDVSRVSIDPGETLRLRFAVCVYHAKSPDVAARFIEYQQLAK